VDKSEVWKVVIPTLMVEENYLEEDMLRDLLKGASRFPSLNVPMSPGLREHQ
jgi:hypothetical protein